MVRNWSITSLPAVISTDKDKITRWTSLVALSQNKNKIPTQNERFLLNQYLHSIKEESDDNFRKFKDKTVNIL